MFTHVTDLGAAYSAADPLKQDLKNEERPDNERSAHHLPDVQLNANCAVLMTAAVVVGVQSEPLRHPRQQP